MKIILVTGVMGSGKSTVIGFLESKTYPVFKADKAAIQCLQAESPCYENLKELFGEEYLISRNGAFDRKKLAQEIFKNLDKKKDIEKIIHPLVQDRFHKFVEQQKKQNQDKVFYEVPLISKEILTRFDKVILVSCPKKLAKRRLLEKGWDSQEVEVRLATQISESEIRNQVNFIINNQSSLEDLKIEIEKVLLDINREEADT